jgi:hypothetical protein
VEPIVEIALPTPAEPAPAAPQPAPAPVVIGFHNKATVRTALHASLIMFFGGFVLTQLTGTGSILLLAIAASGVLSVFLYSRRTGYRMTAIEGARHGWISGLFFFVFVLVLMTLFIVGIMSVPDAAVQIREQLKAQGSLPPEQVTQLIDAIADPGKLAGTMLMGAVFSFVLFTSLSSLGGVLGARLFGAKPSQPRP